MGTISDITADKSITNLWNVLTPDQKEEAVKRAGDDKVLSKVELKQALSSFGQDKVLIEYDRALKDGDISIAEAEDILKNIPDIAKYKRLAGKLNDLLHGDFVSWEKLMKLLSWSMERNGGKINLADGGGLFGDSFLEKFRDVLNIYVSEAGLDAYFADNQDGKLTGEDTITLDEFEGRINEAIDFHKDELVNAGIQPSFASNIGKYRFIIMDGNVVANAMFGQRKQVKKIIDTIQKQPPTDRQRRWLIEVYRLGGEQKVEGFLGNDELTPEQEKKAKEYLKTLFLVFEPQFENFLKQNQYKLFDEIFHKNFRKESTLKGYTDLFLKWLETGKQITKQDVKNL
ncbi:MAG: hypothetical protein NT030_07930 [Candidatus Saganbacteria bacterium]|nr:hypothetical protein [Candidatus Saganbacteria bacterium]